MLRFPNFFAVNVGRSNLPPLLLSVSAAASPSGSRNPPPLLMASRDSMVAEYAKSNRSSCKACSKAIEKKSLRLALVSKGNGPYDVFKWHHLHCFPVASHSPSSPQAIKGFSSLKVHKATEDVENELQEAEEHDSKRRKVHKATEDVENELVENELQETEEHDSKRRKLWTPDVKAAVSIKFSVSDVNSKYKDATLLPKWKAFQTVIFLERDDGLRDSSKIAAFDFDGCLAKTDVKRVGANEWTLMHSTIPDKLQSLYNDGYKLVIFTNESNIERWKNKRQVAVDSKVGRLNNFIERVKVPIQVFIACGVGLKSGADKKNDDAFRKPKPGMWHLMEEHFNSGIVIDMDQSFYVGDAAGRKSDHSDADIKFAEAIGLKFYLPEDYFA
ncbi:polynucleotide 3'-phosphatase ZDP isoform X2 [Vigna radiata var. radiata]|uniref:Polynucleotide 3'-phosphatase ZDP isoform X2 n=1 Tax=Vigna radiata var. radiata TaxID=3916 RepID=A0A1S3THZ4_VIGRR|nr:polynucleotide 3'-phosphatase ZDP isoform X2 [Vigna radiata var. radiata]